MLRFLFGVEGASGGGGDIGLFLVTRDGTALEAGGGFTFVALVGVGGGGMTSVESLLASLILGERLVEAILTAEVLRRANGWRIGMY